jgi:SPP1 family predicted phage head-tail adaptor
MAVFQSLMNNSVTLVRQRRTPDGQGGFAIDYVAQPTVRGRLRPASSGEREVAIKEERQISHVLYVPATTDIRRGDIASVDGLQVDVEAIREPSRANEHYECDCLERQVEVNIFDEGS